MWGLVHWILASILLAVVSNSHPSPSTGADFNATCCTGVPNGASKRPDRTRFSSRLTDCVDGWLSKRAGLLRGNTNRKPQGQDMPWRYFTESYGKRGGTRSTRRTGSSSTQQDTHQTLTMLHDSNRPSIV